MSPGTGGMPTRRVSDAPDESVRVAQARLEGRQDTHEAVCTERHAQNLEMHHQTKDELASVRALLTRIGWGVATAAVTGVLALVRLAAPQIFHLLGLAP